MADQVYPLGLQGFASKQIDFINDNIKILLVSAGYTFNSSHQYISDVTNANIVARSPNLTGKSATNGVLNASTTTVLSVTGATITQIILTQDTGTDSSSRLIAKMDSYTGLPLTPNGGNIPVVFPSDANKIMTI